MTGRLRDLLLSRVLVAGVVAVLVTTGTAAQGATSRTSTTASGRSFGVSMPGVPDDLTQLAKLETELARAPSVVMWYEQWARSPDFPAKGAASVAATGAVPEITWEPWDPSAGTRQPQYSLARIASGGHDAYLHRWARQIRNYRGTVRLRFAHEMNGNWYPWSEQVNGNATGSFVAAWRHVRNLFAADGVRNVTWIWSPNVPYTGSTHLSRLYPGDRYVDAVALDGYNWSTLLPWTTRQTFWETFGPGVRQVRALTTRPLFIGEVASTEIGGGKADWVQDMFATLAAHPEISGFTWFDWNKETDWRIDSSATSLSSFATGLRTYR
jgi:beta-mannanase